MRFLYVILSIIFQILSSICTKYASLSSGNIISIATNPFYALSISFLILQMITWQQALKRYELSFAYPLASLSNFGVLLMAYLLYDEGIRTSNIVGLVIVTIGVYILSKRGGNR